jgi:hypothetical protein
MGMIYTAAAVSGIYELMNHGRVFEMKNCAKEG